MHKYLLTSPWEIKLSLNTYSTLPLAEIFSACSQKRTLPFSNNCTANSDFRGITTEKMEREGTQMRSESLIDQFWFSKLDNGDHYAYDLIVNQPDIHVIHKGHKSNVKHDLKNCQFWRQNDVQYSLGNLWSWLIFSSSFRPVITHEHSSVSAQPHNNERNIIITDRNIIPCN